MNSSVSPRACAASTALAQSAPPPLEYISPRDAERVFEGTQTTAVRDETDTKVAYDVTLTWGLKATAELQNCEDKARAVKCRTLSIIANLDRPDSASRAELLEMVYQNNKRDVYGRAFLNDRGEIIARMAFIATGNESVRGLAQAFAGWDYHVRRFYVALYD